MEKKRWKPSTLPLAVPDFLLSNLKYSLDYTIAETNSLNSIQTGLLKLATDALYWHSFFKSISDILGIPISPSPQIAIFGVPPDELATTSLQRNVMAFASLIARQNILLL